MNGPGDFDYRLPPDRIAQRPAEPRDSARLLVCVGRSIDPSHHVADLPDLLLPGDILVFNATRVRRARVPVRRPTGGKGELLFLRPAGVPSGAKDGWRVVARAAPDACVDWEVLARPSRKLAAGQELVPAEGGADGCRIAVEAELGDGHWRVRISAADHPVSEFFSRHGLVPLPPYFRGRLDSEERYQTVFADREESAASPTAGLHFTEDLLQRLEEAGISRAFIHLEIGADTLRPLRGNADSGGGMRSEACDVGADAAEAIERTKERGGRVIAVGTTVVRTLESSVGPGGRIEPSRRYTDLFIRPGYRFRVVDGLLTNFHAPKTSMIALVAAVYPDWKRAYRIALEEGFKFLSFGDAMLVLDDGVGAS